MFAPGGSEYIAGAQAGVPEMLSAQRVAAPTTYALV